MFVILEEAIHVERDVVLRKYKSGAIIFYQRKPDMPDFLNVYAEADYGDKLNVAECVMKIMKANPEYDAAASFAVMHIAPAKKTDIDTHGRFVLENRNFWTDSLGTIRAEYERHKQVFDAEPETVKMFYSISNDRRCVTYYGSSCEGYSVNRLKNRVKHDVICITYMEYLEHKANVERELVEEKKNGTAYFRNPDGTFEEDREYGRRRHSVRRRMKEGSPLRRSIAAWKESVVFRDFYAYMADRVKGQKELMKVVASVYTYLSCIADGRPTDSNMLLAAPSGCGKTETFRALRDYFKKEIPELPVYQVDMTSITEEGFKGANTKEIVVPLCRCREPEGIGLVFLDEFDKKLVPSYTSGGNNVNAAVQAQILTLLEGRRIQPSQDGPEIDTTNTMFIGLGSFDVCRMDRSTNTHAFGFGTTEEEKPDHYDEITREEMLALGASNELIGRFSSIVNYYKLSEEIVDEIIDRNVNRIAVSLGCAIEITVDKRDELHEQANGKFGCRLLYNDIHDQVLETYAELLLDGKEPGQYTIVLDANGRTKRRTMNKAGENELQEAG